MAMKIKTQITFQAKDEAEAMRVAGDRLGRDAVLLSTQVLKVGGFLGFFRKTVLKVTAAILEEERKPETDTEKKERLAAFQKLLDIKKAIGSRLRGSPREKKIFWEGRKQSPLSPPFPAEECTPPFRGSPWRKRKRRLPKRRKTGRKFLPGAEPSRRKNPPSPSTAQESCSRRLTRYPSVLTGC